MADPVTKISIVNGSFGLAMKAGQVVKELYDIANTFQTLLTLQRPSSDGRQELLKRESRILRTSDESAWAIVNTRASSSIYNSEARTSIKSADMAYILLDCDDELFTARVYKRNYRPKFARKSSKSREEPARDDQVTSTLTSNVAIPEANKVFQNALSSSGTTSKDVALVQDNNDAVPPSPRGGYFESLMNAYFMYSTDEANVKEHMEATEKNFIN
jgi:hypothetical protein